jgi:hypothetical protein
VIPAGGVLFVFVDGVGIGPDDPDRNPFVRAWARGLVPTLQRLVGGTPPTLSNPQVQGLGGSAFPLDANLGVDGMPQSGTGQAALLTGVNAAKEYGRHFGPWTPVALRPLVQERSLLRRAQEAGHRVAFANAYPRGWSTSRRSRRIAGPPLAAQGANLLNRHEEALERGDAVASEIVNEGWRRHLGHTSLPVVTPTEAGANLARIANSADLTLYAHYSTDTVGHRGTMDDAVEALVSLDGFIAGILSELPDGVSMVLTSDHGNLEDTSGGHTRNPALAITTGPAAGSWAGSLQAITDVTPAILESLSQGS